MNRLSNIVAALSLNFVLNGCMTTTRPFYLDELAAQRIEVIRDNSNIANNFISGHTVSELSSNDLDTLRRIIERDYSDYLNKKVEFHDPHFTRTGHMLFIARRGEENIIASKNLYTSSLNRNQKAVLEFLAERYGEEFEAITMNNPDIIQEAGGAIGSDELTELFDREHNVQPRYAAFISDMSGYAIPIAFVHYVNLRPDIGSLTGLIHTWEHEYAHTLIYNEMGLDYSLSLLGSYTGISSNMEIISVHETACEIISNNVQEFFSRHLEEIFNEDYFNGIELEKKLDSIIEDIVLDYHSIPRRDRLARRDEIFNGYSRQIEERTGVGMYNLNEARLALMRRYSGERRIRSELEVIHDRLGHESFIQIIPSIYNFSDLHFAYRLSLNNPDIFALFQALQSKHARERPRIDF